MEEDRTHQQAPNDRYYDWLFDSSQILMLVGLQRLIARNPERLVRARHVCDAITSYQDFASRHNGLPTGVTETYLRFFAVTAGLGYWEEMDTVDPRVADSLLAYYLPNLHERPDGDATLEDVVHTVAGVESLSTASYLIRVGINYLRSSLPAHGDARVPLDREVVFPKSQLRRMHHKSQAKRDILSAAQRKAWANPERREKGLEVLQRMRRSKHLDPSLEPKDEPREPLS